MHTIAQLFRAISLQLRHLLKIRKKLLNSNISSTCPHNMVNFVSLAAEIGWQVWGTPANFNGFQALASLLSRFYQWHSTDGTTYIWLGGHHIGHRPTFLFVICYYLLLLVITRRPSSADRTARRQFQATGQLVSRTQASDTMTSRLPRYEAKCAQRRCFQCGSVLLRSDIKGTELPSANTLIPLERQLIAL